MRQHTHWTPTPESPYILNLDENFKPFTNGVELEFKKFDFLGGEPHFQILTKVFEPSAKLVITQRYNTIGDLFNIILANDAARRMGFRNIELILPYFPACRQDRVCNDGEPLTIKVFTDMINGCGFNSVSIFTPHSEVTPALLNNVHIIDELQYITDIVRRNLSGHFFNVVCPDAGAGKRVGKIVQHLANTFGYVQFNLIRCEKVRDVKDGSLKEFFVQADDLQKYPTMIFDDINARGGTFIGLGKVLREKNCGELSLYTSHSDCVEGINNVSEFFDNVYTSNSKRNWIDLIPKIENFGCFSITL